jgi:2-methylisocitrate lyase-like PEP mutase family enzyme
LLGRRDGRLTRGEALAQARVICNATDLPVSADLEKGFGDAPEIMAATMAPLEGQRTSHPPNSSHRCRQNNWRRS